MTSEAEILKRVHLAAGGLPGVRLFRNQVGIGAAGVIIDRPGADLLLVRGRPVTMGLAPGSSDLIGWRVVTITPEMVGRQIAQFTAVEVKNNTGRIAAQQQHFIDVLHAAGGCTGIARSAADAIDIVKERG